MNSKLTCPEAGTCGGCAWYNLTLQQQLQNKIEFVIHALKTNGVRAPDANQVIGHIGELSHFRNRADFVFDGGPPQRFGLWDLEHQTIIDISECAVLTEDLQAWLTEFRAFQFPIRRGSIRLRVAPDGTKGVWLDFANTDVKALLDERALLESLLNVATVEIGQKRKRLYSAPDRLRLGDAVMRPWFQIPAGGLIEKSYDLHSTIGSFTQTGSAAAGRLVNLLLNELREADSKTALELGAGIGTLTIPMLAQGLQVTAFELESAAVEGLKLTAAFYGLSHSLEIQVANFHRSEAFSTTSSAEAAGSVSWLSKALLDANRKFDAIVVDPPRSGLGSDFHLLGTAKTDLPKTFIYISCFAESFARDTTQLLRAGYRLSKLQVLDQFSHSPHFEVVATFKI